MLLRGKLVDHERSRGIIKVSLATQGLISCLFYFSLSACVGRHVETLLPALTRKKILLWRPRVTCLSASALGGALPPPLVELLSF